MYFLLHQPHSQILCSNSWREWFYRFNGLSADRSEHDKGDASNVDHAHATNPHKRPANVDIGFERGFNCGTDVIFVTNHYHYSGKTSLCESTFGTVVACMISILGNIQPFKPMLKYQVSLHVQNLNFILILGSENSKLSEKGTTNVAIYAFLRVNF